jgi:4-amino-4-deoxy-L-arabinose transferase-like glycosyltransferase
LGLLFIILGLGYSTFTPIFENSDETLHYPYIKHLADGLGLPLAAPGQLWNQEGTQPPLYYAIVAASTFWIDSDNLPELLQRNPHWRFTEVRALINDNQNLVLHGPPDAWPYQRAALAVHLGRWWSLLFGLLTVSAAFLLARRLFPANLPLTATTLMALNPQFIRVSATVSNDSLSAALTTWTVLAAFWLTEPPTQRVGESASYSSPLRRFAPLLLGLLTGLAVLAKLSSLSTLFLVAFILFWRLFFLSQEHQNPLQKLLRWWVIIAVVTAGLTGWWFWRNYTLYGEWFATEIHLNLAGRSDLSLAQIWNLRTEAERAYWATFGWGQIRPPEWVYRLLFGFSRVGCIGLVLALLAKLVQGNKSRPLPLNLQEISFEKIIPLLLWAILNLAFYLRWLMEVGSVSHTRLVFPAIAPISLLLALGWHALLPRRLAAWFSGGVIAAFLALNVYSLGWLLYPAFRPVEPANQPITQFEQHTSTLNLTFLNAIDLVIGDVYVQPHDSSVKAKREARAGDVVMVNALWQVLDSLDKNYSVAVLLLTPDGSVLARRETYPGLGLRPTRYLRPGDSFLDAYPLKLTKDVAEPVVARAVVNLFDFESDTRAGFPALDAGNHAVTPIVGQLKIVPQTWPQYQPGHAVRVNFSEAIALIGYDLKVDRAAGEQGNEGVAPEGFLTLKLYWQSLAPVSEDYSVFVHLLNDRGEMIGQADGPPTNNAYPTRWWSPGEVIADTHLLPTVPGAAAIRLGLYQLASGQRLSIGESTLPQQDKSVEISLP